ncbi:hypothetical protein [Pseudolysinimonas kribbensis]|uniref:hypothetical protein n=1 Tax=Pseudolysinimonas kribbensis TaxID=433641 RepID=UPI0024E0F47D|nr:hypothetical protein [Pseudolysinimonas kribbensis]
MIQAPTASSTPAARGARTSSRTPTRAAAVANESMRVSAIGPSSSRSASHHQAASAPRRSRPKPVTNANATASTTKTRLSQVGAIRSGPNRFDAIIGGRARIGYTHDVWMPTQTCRDSPCSIHAG